MQRRVEPKADEEGESAEESPEEGEEKPTQPFDSDLGADMRGDAIVVTGDYLQLDSILPQGRHNLCCIGQRLVSESKETGEDQIALVLRRIIRLGRNFNVGDCQRAETLTVQLIADLLHAPGCVVSNRHDLAFTLKAGKQWENAFWRAFRDEYPLRLPFHHHREAPLSSRRHCVQGAER